MKLGINTLYCPNPCIFSRTNELALRLIHPHKSTKKTQTKYQKYIIQYHHTQKFTTTQLLTPPHHLIIQVTSHQDSTFLFTEPKQSCLGLWLALEDATETNGCLWCRPGSHREPVRRQFVRNKAYFEVCGCMVFRNLCVYLYTCLYVGRYITCVCVL